VKQTNLIFLSTRSQHQIPVIHVKQEQSKYTLVFSHGNAEDVGAIEHWLYRLSNYLKVSIVVYDYPGYGLSTWSTSREEKLEPSEQLCYEACDAVYKYLVTQGVKPADSLIAYGRSLGTGVTVDIASRKPFRGVILQSPFRSAVRVVSNTFVTLPLDIFVSQDKIRKVYAPIYIFHGKSDTVINYQHAIYLYELLNKKYAYQPWWIDGAGHNDIESVHLTEYLKHVSNFLQALDVEKFPTKPVALQH